MSVQAKALFANDEVVVVKETGARDRVVGRSWSHGNGWWYALISGGPAAWVSEAALLDKEGREKTRGENDGTKELTFNVTVKVQVDADLPEEGLRVEGAELHLVRGEGAAKTYPRTKTRWTEFSSEVAASSSAPQEDEDLWADYRTGRGIVFASDRKAFLAGVRAGRRTHGPEGAPEAPAPSPLTRGEAHRALIALEIPFDTVVYMLDHPDEVRSLFGPGLSASVVPSKEAVAIVEAYQRRRKSKTTPDPLTTVPEEERERIRLLGRSAWVRTRRETMENKESRELADAMERTVIDREVAAYHARTEPQHGLNDASSEAPADGASRSDMSALLANLEFSGNGLSTMARICRTALRLLDARDAESPHPAPKLTCAECHRPVGSEVAHIDCDCPELGLVGSEQGYQAGKVEEAVEVVARAMTSRPGITWSTAIKIALALCDGKDIVERARTVMRLAHG